MHQLCPPPSTDTYRRGYDKGVLSTAPSPLYCTVSTVTVCPSDVST
jgi:hypothetical protein